MLIVLLLRQKGLFNIDFDLGFPDLGLLRSITFADRQQAATGKDQTETQDDTSGNQTVKLEERAILDFQDAFSLR